MSEDLEGISWLTKRLGVSESSVRRHVRRGIIPCVKIGDRLLFRPSSIERFIEEREQGGDVPARRGRRPKTAVDAGTKIRVAR